MDFFVKNNICYISDFITSKNQIFVKFIDDNSIQINFFLNQFAPITASITSLKKESGEYYTDKADLLDALPQFLSVSSATNLDVSYLTVGNKVTGDYTEINADGVIRLYGKATVFDDIVGNLLGRALSTIPGKVSYDQANNTVVFNSGGVITNEEDRIILNIQKPHKTKPESFANFHVHWLQTNETERIFTLQYRIQKNGQGITTDWVTVTSSTLTNNVFPFIVGGVNQITRLASIDLSDTGISSTIQIRFARTDSNTGNISAIFMDAHFEFDNLGSNTEYEKY